MSYNGGGAMNKRPLENPPYQGSGGYQGGSADMKRSRPEMGSGGGVGANNLSMYGPPGGNGGSRNIDPSAGSPTGNHPRRPGMEVCMHFRRTGNCKFGSNCRYDHQVDGPSSPGQKGEFRGRAVAVRNPTSNGPPPHSSQQHPRQGGQQHQGSGGYQTQQHGHAQQPSPAPTHQQHQPSSSPHQPYSQQPQQLSQHGSQVSQQGGTGHSTQEQGSNPSGASETTSTGAFNGNAFGAGYANNATISSPSTPVAQAPAHVTAYASATSSTAGTSNPQGYPISATQGNVFSPTPGGVAAVSAYGGSLGATGPVSPGSASTFANANQMQQTSSYRSSSTQQSGNTPTSNAPGATATATNPTSTGGWVYDPAAGGYKVASSPAATPPTTTPCTAAPGAAGSSVNGTPQSQGQLTSQQQQREVPQTGSAGTGPPNNLYNTPVPAGATPGYGISGSGSSSIQGGGTGSGCSSSGTQENPFVHPQSAGSVSSSVYSGAPEQRTFGASGSVAGAATSGEVGGATTSVGGSYATPATASATHRTPATSGYGAPSTAVHRQSNYGANPQCAPAHYGTQGSSPGTATTTYGSASQQSGYQAVSSTPGYGTEIPASGSNSGAYATSSGYAVSSTYGQQSQQAPSASQRPGQQGSVYGRAGSSTTASSAANGTSSNMNTASRGKNSSGENSANSNSVGVTMASSSPNVSGSGRDSATAGGSRASSAGNRGSSNADTVGVAGGTGTASTESSSTSGTSGAKEPHVPAAVAAYAAQQVPANPGPSAGNANVSGGASGSTVTASDAGVPPGPIYPQQSTAAVASASNFAAMGGMMGFGVPPPGVQYAVATVPSANGGPQQLVQATNGVSAPSNPYGAPVAQPLQQPQQSMLQQQPIAATGQYMMPSQGQTHPHLQQPPQGQQPQTWHQPQQHSIPQPLQQQPSPASQPGVGQPTAQGVFPSYGPGMPAPAPQQQPTIAPFGQPMQQQPPQQQQPLPQQGPGGPGIPGGGFNGASRPAGVFQSNGQGPPPQGIPAGNLMFSHPVPGTGNMPPQIMNNPTAGNMPSQGMMPPAGERGGGREGRGRDGRDIGDGREGREGREGNKFSPSNPAPHMPQRSSQPECNHFVKTGFCRYGTTCKYHHPYHKVGQQPLSEPSGGSRNTNVVQQQDRAPCDVYLNTGVCTFGEKCRFRHISRGQLAMESAQGVTHPDPNQLPHRAGLPPCGFYTRTGKCAFGMKCKFDHPQHRNPNNSNSNAGNPSGSGSSGFVPAVGRSSAPPPQQNAGPVGRGPLPSSPSMKSDPKGGPTEVTARHILIKHKGSRRPASWQDPSGAVIKQRTQAQATAMLHSLRSAIKTEDDFAKVAMAKSDCSSAKRGGDLSSFGRGKMQRAFEDAAFGLEIGGVSEVVATDSGVHLIMRTA